MSVLPSWWGPITRQQFANDYFHKLPYSATCPDPRVVELASWSTVERLVGQSDVDLMVCRRGVPFDGRPPTTAAEARRLWEDGHTILIRHAERHDDRLAELASAFALDFGGQVNVHIYATPADQFGFGWHYDAEDVFILQTEGAKEYSLRKNTVHPWPVLETLPDDMQYERELMPLMRCLLHAGDWLYIPAGYWHMALAGSASVSLAVGILSPTALDVLPLARRRMAQSLLWRQRLPVAGEASPLDSAQRREQLRDTLAYLARDIHELLLSEEFLDEVVRQRW